MKKFFALLFLCLFIKSNVMAVTIPQGTLVVVQPAKLIDADKVRTGDKVLVSVTQPVKINGETVIKMGTEVNAKITKRKNNGILGIPGELDVWEFQIITPKSDTIRLSGIVSDNGEGRYWANVGWIFVFPLLFIKGNDGKIMQNTTYMLYTAEDVKL